MALVLQLALLDELHSAEERRWYAAKAMEHNWSRNVLVMQIESNAPALARRSLTAPNACRHCCPARLSSR